MVDSLDTWINFNEIDEINTGLDDLKSEINSNQNVSKRIDNWEQIEKYVEPEVIIDAMFSYFKKKVKFFRYLNSEIKKEISSVLKSYFSKHHFLAIWKDGKMKLVVDDVGKSDFVAMSKKIITIMKNEVMNNELIRSSLRLWWKYKKVVNYFDKLCNYFNKLDNNLYNMPTMKYMEIMFGYVWWIVKEVLLKEKSWSMTIGEFYGYISSCYANKHGEALSKIMSSSHRKWDTKPIKYVSITDATWVGPGEK